MKTTSYQGVTISDEDVLRAMERFDKDIRPTFPDRRWRTYAVKYNDRLYPPKPLLRLATGLERIGGGGRPVNSRFEELGFEIDFVDANGDDGAGITSDDEDTEADISLEVDIENALVGNLEQLEKGLRLYEEHGKTGRQFVIKFDAKKQGRIDLLAVAANGDFVVIEIKAVEADRDVCGQIQAYMGWVKENLAAEKHVRGIIVANDFTVRAIYAAKVVPGLCLQKFQVSFKFRNA
jgi:hypothetical protein